MHLPIPLIGLLLLICSSCSVSGEGTHTHQSDRTRTGVAAENGLQEFAEYARAFDWVATAPSPVSDLACGALLGELRNPKLLKQVLPRIETKSADDATLIEISRCANYNVKERDGAPVPNNFVTGTRDFGDQNFQLFRVKSGRPSLKVWDLIYSEYREEKILTNAFFDGYTVVDLKNCIKGSGVTTQRADVGSQKGATRQILKGLFQYKSRALVLTTTEQIGQTDDPESYRSIDAWPLTDDGQFTAACHWIPKRLAEQVKLGVAQ